MRIFMMIPQYFIASTIASICEREGNTCTLFSSPFEIFSMLENTQAVPDLIVFDYMVFDHGTFNIHRYMKKRQKKIPVIFYNDPFPPTGRRHAHWESTLSLVNSDFFEPEKYRAIFKTIASCVESEYVRPYVPLLQPPRPEPFAVRETIKRIAEPSQETELSYIESYLNLSGTMLMLFELLYKNRSTSISVSSIKARLTKYGNPVKTTTIYALIKRLREKFAITQEVEAEIATTTNGYRLFIREREKRQS